ncbi:MULTISPECIES: M2 family metallopeptidase [Caldisericum]|uniref:Peptidase M3A and M3B thimet/oligopeptidase F n=1 Tax=Caldisericum exile TaxID=693075 RepID=A0A2J6WEC9_9BACT|nr:MAG: peptidase M3A and M3B thimet/oligopeptidase F [Caldisericum exile]
MDIKELLNKVNSDLERLYKASAIAYWNLATTGKEEYAKELEQSEVELKLYLSNRDLFEMIKESLEKYSDNLDSLEKRQLTILFNEMLPNQLPKEAIEEVVKREVEIETIYANYRPQIDGKEVSTNDIVEILKTSKDIEERKKAYLASKSIGGVIAPKLIELIKIRNENAKSLGFSNYYDMMMELQELSTDEIHSLFAKIKNDTDEVFTEIKDDIDTVIAKKFGVPKSEVKPWLYEDLFFQEVPSIDDYNYDEYLKDKDIVKLVMEVYSRIGLDIKDIVERSDLYERKGKNPHAFTISIDKMKDVRVLENIRNDVKWLETTLHEYGHAVYDKYIDKSLPFILRDPAHIFTTEAVAMFFGRLARHPEFYEKILNIPEEKLSEISPRLMKLLRYQLAITTRWVITFVFFEKELYKNPDGDLNNLWYDIVHELQYVDLPERRNYPDWASKIHFGSSPVYYHNYLLGEILASQFSAYIKANFGDGFIKPQVGEFFVERVFKKGASLRWDDLVEFATKEPLNPAYLVSFIKEK